MINSYLKKSCIITALCILAYSTATTYAQSPDINDNGYEIVNDRGISTESTLASSIDNCLNNSISYETLVKIPGLGSKNADGKNIVTICPNSLGEYLQVGFNYFIGVAILLAVIMIIYGGVLYATTEAVTGKSNAKETIVGAAQGLALALGSYLILVTINPDLIKFQLDIGTVKLQKAGEGGVGSVATIQDGALGGTSSGVNRCGPAPSLVAIKAEATRGEIEKTTAATADRFYKMREAALADGVNLKVSDGYRSDREQVFLWKKYNGKNVARPCSLGGNGSNHQSGDALDISVGCGNPSSGCSTTAYKWLKANGGRFGFYNNIPTDPPHWSATGK